MTEQTNKQATSKRTDKPRGFSTMSAEKRREIARKGGIAAHAMGRAHKWTHETAQAAGRKGGTISRRRKRDLSPEEAAALRAMVQQIEASE